MCLALCCTTAWTQENRWQELTDAAKQAQQEKRYDEAERLFSSALQEAETFGEHDRRLATALDNLAGFLHQVGKFLQAEPFYVREVTLLEKIGANSAVALAASRLAWLFVSQARYSSNPNSAYFSDGPYSVDTYEKYGQAEQLVYRALALQEKAGNDRSVDSAEIMSTLASIRWDFDRQFEAIEIYQSMLAIYESSRGPDHPSVARTLNNLGVLHRQRGYYSEAEQYHRRSLEIYEKSPGPERHGYPTALFDLARLFEAQGKGQEAEELYHRALSEFETSPGLWAGDRAWDLYRMSRFYRRSGQYGKAVLYSRRSLAAYRADLAPSHPAIYFADVRHRLLLEENENHKRLRSDEVNWSLVWRRMGTPIKGAVVLLALMLLFSISLILDRLASFSMVRSQSGRFVLELNGAFEEHRLEEAISIADKYPKGHIARLVASALVNFQEFSSLLSDQMQIESAKVALHKSVTAVREESTRGLGRLVMVKTLAPLVGVFGTTVGIVNSFPGCGMQQAACIAITVARITEAIPFMAVGFLVALLAWWGYNYLSNRVETFEEEMNVASLELLNYLTNHLERQKKLQVS